MFVLFAFGPQRLVGTDAPFGNFGSRRNQLGWVFHFYSFLVICLFSLLKVETLKERPVLLALVTTQISYKFHL